MAMTATRSISWRASPAGRTPCTGRMAHSSARRHRPHKRGKRRIRRRRSVRLGLDAHKAAPGELLAVTHAVFMAWALSEVLAAAGSPADELIVSVECTFAGPVAERELVAVALQVYGFVPGVDAATFHDAAVVAQRRYLRSCGAQTDIPSELSVKLAGGV